MNKLIITKGLPASGKSTWSKEYVLANKGTIRVNNDELASLMFGEPFKGNDTVINDVRMHIVKLAMQKQKDVLVDNTNLHPAREADYKALVDAHNENPDNEIKYELVIKDFTDVPPQACVVRNAGRATKVPEKVIWDMYSRYVKGEIPIRADTSKVEQKALIVDIDGTIADAAGKRCIYDTTKYDQDEVIVPVWDLISKLWAFHKPATMIFLTGRDERGRGQTVTWLKDKLGLAPEDYQLLMRPDGNNIPDYVFKEEAFNTHIDGKYHVIAWFEDRFRNVMMARTKLGLIPVFQVGDGGF